MKSKRIKDGHFIRLVPGEDVLESLIRFVEEHGIQAGTISGIGAADKVRCGYYRVEDKGYPEETFEGDLEILSLMGNISWLDGEPVCHVHIIFSDEQMRAHGGHLFEAVISATCEIHINVLDQRLERKPDAGTGLNLLDL